MPLFSVRGVREKRGASILVNQCMEKSENFEVWWGKLSGLIFLFGIFHGKFLPCSIFLSRAVLVGGRWGSNYLKNMLVGRKNCCWLEFGAACDRRLHGFVAAWCFFLDKGHKGAGDVFLCSLYQSHQCFGENCGVLGTQHGFEFSRLKESLSGCQMLFFNVFQLSPWWWCLAACFLMWVA